MTPPLLETFLRYCVVGGSGSALSWGLFYFLTRRLGIRDYLPTRWRVRGRQAQVPWAIAMVTAVVVVWNFTLNLLWTFAG